MVRAGCCTIKPTNMFIPPEKMPLSGPAKMEGSHCRPGGLFLSGFPVIVWNLIFHFLFCSAILRLKSAASSLNLLQSVHRTYASNENDVDCVWKTCMIYLAAQAQVYRLFFSSCRISLCSSSPHCPSEWIFSWVSESNSSFRVISSCNLRVRRQTSKINSNLYYKREVEATKLLSI